MWLHFSHAGSALSCNLLFESGLGKNTLFEAYSASEVFSVNIVAKVQVFWCLH